MSRHAPPYTNSLREETALFLSRLQESKFNVPTDDIGEIVDLLAIASSIMKNILNSHRPVNQVPDEILAHIFALVPSEVHAYRSDWFDSPVRVTAELIPLTHVCRRWREVALSNHFLWTSINPTWKTIPMHSVFLERAGTSFLTCDAQVTYGVEKDFWLTVLRRHASRIRYLQLVYREEELFNALKELPMPELVEFVLGGPNAKRASRFFPGNRDFCLFGGHAPRLQRLTLCSSLEGFPTNRFDALTNLHLNEGRKGSIDGDKLAAFLSLCRNLQRLVITTHLLVFPEDVTHIMSSFILSSHVAVAIWYMPISWTADTTWLREFTVFPPSAPIRVNFDLCRSSHVMVAATDDFSICIDRIPRICYEAIHQLQSSCSCLPCGSVKELWVRIDSAFEYGQLLALGQIFSSIETLVLHYVPPRRDSMKQESEDCWQAFATPVFPIHPGVSRVRICTWYGSIPSAIMGGLSVRAQTANRVAHLVIELPVWRDVRFTIAELEEYADVVEVVGTRSCTLMKVPDVYSNSPHFRWHESLEKLQLDDSISWRHPVEEF